MVNGRVNGKVFYEQRHKEKIDYEKANKNKIKISLKKNLMSRLNQNKFQPKQ